MIISSWGPNLGSGGEAMWLFTPNDNFAVSNLGVEGTVRKNANTFSFINYGENGDAYIHLWIR
jgi:hypothetical protein